MKSPVTASLLLTLSLLSACGGGGGGGSGDSLVYTGETSQAVITADNAEELAVAAYSGVSSAIIASAALGADANPSTGPGTPALFPLVELVKTVLTGPLSSAPPTATGLAQEETRDGPCGGQVTIALASVFPTVSGTVSANGFCVAGVYMSGQLVINGYASTSGLESAVLTYSGLSLTGTEHSTTSSGELSADIYTSFIRMTINELTRVDDTGRVYQREDARLGVSANANNSTLTLYSGRYYDPLYGYVNVTTTTPLTIYPDTTSPWPTAGVMTLEGTTTNGSATSSLTLTAQANSYLLELDSDGDGNVDQTFTPSWPTSP